MAPSCGVNHWHSYEAHPHGLGVRPLPSLKPGVQEVALGVGPLWWLHNGR